MKKGFRKKIILTFVVLLVLLTTLVASITFMDANRFKPLIASEIKQTTGLQLSINGDISWSILPQLGFKVGHLVVQDPDKPKNKIAEVKSLVLGFQFLPLLQGIIHVDRIKAEELVIFLNKNTVKLNISVAAKGYIDLINKNLKLSEIDGDLNSLKLKGEILVANVNEKLQAKGNFKIQASDFKKWLQELGIQNDSLQTANKLSGVFNFTSQTSFKSLNLNGNIQLKELKMASLTTKNLNAQVQLKDGNLTLAPIKSELYQGALEGRAKINLNNAEPQINLQATLANIEAKDLLADLATHSKIKFTGKGNINFQLNTAGSSGASLVRNLNGSGKLTFANGAVSGIDVVYLVFTAYALINHQAPPAKQTNDTQFGGLTGTFNIKHGLLSNQDLKLTTSLLLAQGKGEIDLVSRRINYQILASNKQNTSQSQQSTAADLLGFILPTNNLASLNSLVIPILISGSLDNPHTSLDMKTLLAEVAKSQLKSTIGQSIGGKALQAVPGLQVLPFLQSLPTK